ncbi:MAG: hypothetical protein ACTSXD_10565 [Candidatus Heimdallarchaeaceae archaeon]
MNKQKLTFLILFLVIFSVVSLTPPSVGETNEINGIYYSHEVKTFSESGSYSYFDYMIVDEEYKETTMYSGPLDLVTGYELVNAIYLIVDYRYYSWGNGSESEFKVLVNNETMVDYVNNKLMPRIWTRSANYDVSLNVTSDLPNEVLFLSTEKEYLGQSFMNSTLIEFIDSVDEYGLFKFYHLVAIIPVAMFIQITTETFQVTVNSTFYARNLIGGYVAYGFEYNATMTGYNVIITDGTNIGLNYFGCIKSNIEYAEVLKMEVGFFRFYLNNVTITSDDPEFSDYGGNVPYNYYPRNMLPKLIADQGHQSFEFTAYGRFQSRSTAQAVVQAFISRSTNATIDHFAVWGTLNPSRMIAYYDGNNNNQLDVYLDNSGNVKHDPIDWVKYIGFPEAHKNEYFVTYNITNNYTSIVHAPGAGIYNNININNTEVGEKYVVEEIGDIDAEINYTPRWNDPVENDDGSVTFSWGIDYNNYPVLWYNTSDTTITTDPMDISYDYSYTVNLDTGEASLATTSIFGGITDTTLKNSMNDLSLATYQVSEMLTVEDVTAKTDEEGIGSSVPATTTEVSIEYSDDTALIDISLGGSKLEYSIDGSTYNTNTTVLNLVYLTGQKTFSNSTEIGEFESESDDIGQVMTDSEKQETTLNWLYRKDLIIINYPVWDGKQITHDPEFKTYFEPNPQPTEQTEPTETTVPTDTQPTNTPGFGAFIVISTVFMTTFLFRKRKN